MDGDLSKILGGTGGSLYKPEQKPVFTWGFLSVAGLAFGIVFIIFLGLEVGYKTLLKNSISQIETETQKISEKRKSDSESDSFTSGFIDFYSQATNAKKLLNSHTSFLPVFEFIESNTRQDIYYQAFQIDKTSEMITVSGIAKGYAALSSQLAIFNSLPQVKKVTMSGIGENEDGTTFEFKIVVDPILFKYDILRVTTPIETESQEALIPDNTNQQ